MVVETHSAASICAMVRAGAGISVVNPLTATDYADSGVVVRRFSVEVPFTVSLIRPSTARARRWSTPLLPTCSRVCRRSSRRWRRSCREHKVDRVFRVDRRGVKDRQRAELGRHQQANLRTAENNPSAPAPPWRRSSADNNPATPR